VGVSQELDDDWGIMCNLCIVVRKGGGSKVKFQCLGGLFLKNGYFQGFRDSWVIPWPL